MVESVVMGWSRTVWVVVVAASFLLSACSSGDETASSTTVDPVDFPWVEDQRVPAKGIGGSLVFLPDSSELLIGSGDGVVVWDVATETVTTFDVHGFHASELAVGNQGLAASATNEDGYIWDIASKEVVHELDLGRLFGLVFSPDGSLLAVSGVGPDRDEVVVLEVRTGERVHTLEGHEDNVSDVFFTPDGSRLLSASRDRTVRVWDVDSGEELSVLPRVNKAPFAAISPDGSTLAVPEANGEVWLRDVETGEVVQKVPVEQRNAESGSIESLEFSPDGNEMLISGVPSAVLLDIETGETIQQFPGTSYRGIGEAAFSPDGDLIAVGDIEEDVVIYKRNPK